MLSKASIQRDVCDWFCKNNSKAVTSFETSLCSRTNDFEPVQVAYAILMCEQEYGISIEKMLDTIKVISVNSIVDFIFMNGKSHCNESNEK